MVDSPAVLGAVHVIVADDLEFVLGCVTWFVHDDEARELALADSEPTVPGADEPEVVEPRKSLSERP